MKSMLKIIFRIAIIILVIFFTWYLTRIPSLNRDWNDDQKILANISFN